MSDAEWLRRYMARYLDEELDRLTYRLLGLPPPPHPPSGDVIEASYTVKEETTDGDDERDDARVPLRGQGRLGPGPVD